MAQLRGSAALVRVVAALRAAQTGGVGCRLALVALAALLMTGAPGARPAAAGEAAPVQVAQALNAAWNRGGLEEVVGLFAEDGQVRQTGATVLAFGAAVQVDDVYGSGMSAVPLAGEEPAMDGEEIVWARGRAAVGDWAASLLRAGHRVSAGGYEVEGDVVRWSYQVPSRGAAMRIAGLPPGEGKVEARVVSGKIHSLTLTSAAGTAAQRERAIDSAAAAVRAAGEAGGVAPAFSGGSPSTQGRTTPSPAAWLVAAGSVTLVALLASRRPAH